MDVAIAERHVAVVTRSMTMPFWKVIRKQPVTSLWLMACFSAAIYGIVAALSRSFLFGQGFVDRPIIAVLLAFALGFVIYVAAMAVAIQASPTRRLFVAIVVPALLFRTILLFSEPIQEIDIYRYLWDGTVSVEGVSPFQFSPAAVLKAQNAELIVDPDLKRLAALRDGSPALYEILRRIHYAHLPTVYPPVGQAVFRLASLLMPANATLWARVVIMKAVLIVFDIATLVIVFRLLRTAGRHPGWAIAYGWCPLVLKEFANSGHLDAIAVLFATAGVWGVVESCLSIEKAQARWRSGCAAVMLALSVGAKLYAVVLVPWMLVLLVRRQGWRTGSSAAVMFAICAVLSLYPMISDSRPPLEGADSGQPALPPVPDQIGSPASIRYDPTAGLRTFLRHWEMNDLIFSVVLENIRPAPADPPTQVWFAVTPISCRRSVVEPIERRLQIDAAQASFLVARLCTAVAFAAVAIVLAWRASRHTEVSCWLEAAFLTLAWFWLLAPTQNPWYWTWALPLLPFATGRAWFALSGIVFAYYLRFWLLYHRSNQPVFLTPYSGAQFFDFVITWIEFGPWFLWLASETIVRRLTQASERKEMARRRQSVCRFTEQQFDGQLESDDPDFKHI